MNAQCFKCDAPAEFGYKIQGSLQWFCAGHRLSKNYADARVPVPVVVTDEDMARAKLPDTYVKARSALQECVEIDECQDWASKAAAMAAYGRMAKDIELRNMAARIQARAVNRIGELMQEIPKEGGGRPSENSGGAQLSFSPREQARVDAGLSHQQVKTALRVSNVPRDRFEEQVESANPPSVTALARQGTTSRPVQTEPKPVDETALIAKLANGPVTEIRIGLRQLSLAGRLRLRQLALEAWRDAALNEPDETYF